MNTPITQVTIVGGGTAGWIVAAYLNHRLQWGPTARPGVRISLIESPGHPTVGVGEATVPSLKGTMRLLDISEAEFFLRTEATIKLGIRYDRWQADDDGRPHSFVHPFTGGASLQGHNPGYSFQQFGLPIDGGAKGHDFVRTVSHAREAIDASKGPRALDAPPFGGVMQYAYHVDAVRLAHFFKDVCLARGVEYVSDDVIDTTLDDRGFITSLQLRERGVWPVELVIDCTGFSGRLINRALEEPFISFANYLPNDRAIPIQVAHRTPRQLVPATISTAFDAGWCWRVPLHTRVGTGYVYSSAFTSDDAAARELDRELGDDVHLTDARVIHMRIGRCRRSWVNNCVAIGLSSGFLEPLESTAILSIELASRWLVQYFPSTACEAPLRAQFNAAVERFYEEVRDFLGLHYRLNNRTDTAYWKAARHDLRISDRLRDDLALWQHALPSVADPRTDAVFGNWSVQCVLFGKDFYRGRSLAGLNVVTERAWKAYWGHCRAEKASTLASLPSHEDLVEAIRASAVPGETIGRRPRTWRVPTGDEGWLNTQIMSPSPRTRVQIPDR